MVDWKSVFEEIASEIYRGVKPIFRTAKVGEIIGRGAGGDLTRHIDALAEGIAIKTLERNNVSCILVSEETGTKTIGQNAKDYVILDPVDGTTNTFCGIPFFCTSIALASEPQLTSVKLGLIKDLNSGATFYAGAGKGAYEGEKPLISSNVTTVAEAMIGIEVSIPGNTKFLASLVPLLSTTKKIRHLGSTALETCYVGAGLMDAFIDNRGMIRATDIAAAYLIVKEAGGVMVTPKGEELDMILKATERTAYIAAANKTLADDIIRLLKTG
jgi:myo-inositol-1(or 4)-monophosphatase